MRRGGAYLPVMCYSQPASWRRCPPTPNGTEFVNSIVSALFNSIEVTVRHEAIRHPQAQGPVERFNRTLLTLIRKILHVKDDGKTALVLQFFHYRVRPHVATKISPSEAMHSWSPGNLVVKNAMTEQMSKSVWVGKLKYKSARFVD